MPRGRKRAEVAAEPSRARERDQSALRETDKDVGLVIPSKSLNTCEFNVAR